MTLSAAYADFILQVNCGSLPTPVIGQVKRLTLDLLGVALAGYGRMPFPRMVTESLAALGGRPQASILLHEGKYPAIHAAFANAACAHGLDMDDGHRFGALHPGAVIVPAALAAGELAGAGMPDVIAGIVAGYEVMIRIGVAISPSCLNRGFHITGVTGPFGAAAAACRILGLNRRQIRHALGLAGLQSSGLIQVNHEIQGAQAKPLNPARAAQSGLWAAVLARDGAPGPEEIFEGEDGFLKAFADGVDRDALIAGLGERYETLNIYFKLYAACRHAHAAIDAVVEIASEEKPNPEQVAGIRVETYPAAIRLAGIRKAETPASARFSIPFSVALALVRGSAGAGDYVEGTVTDPGIQALASKVDLVASPRWEAAYPRQRGATVVLTRKDGGSRRAEVPLAKGEPENPATWEQLYGKYTANAAAALTEEGARRLGEAVGRLQELSIEELAAHLRKPAFEPVATAASGA